MNAVQLLPLIRELFSRNPEYRDHEPWELQHVLWSLGYIDELADEGEVEGAVAKLVAHGDWTGEAA